MSNHKEADSTRGTMNKDVPVENVEVFDSDKERVLTLNLSSTKTADLYDKTLYTVVKRGHDFNLGIFPQDQGFSSKYVLLWHNRKDLLRFDNRWDVVKVEIADYAEVSDLGFYSAIPGVYAVRSIPVHWQVEVLNSQFDD
jgi:hypothetical protein